VNGRDLDPANVNLNVIVRALDGSRTADLVGGMRFRPERSGGEPRLCGKHFLRHERMKFRSVKHGSG